jgi:hypothetical protein
MSAPARYWLIHLTRTADTSGWYTGGSAPPPGSPLATGAETTLVGDPSVARRFEDLDHAERLAQSMRDEGAADHVDVFEYLDGDADL